MASFYCALHYPLSNLHRIRPICHARGGSWRRASACRLRRSQAQVGGRVKLRGDFEQLVDWLNFHEGYVHEALELVDVAPCGSRGLICAQDIPLQRIREGPVIIVPEKLHMTPEAAQERLTPLLKPLGLPSVERWLEDYQIALLLAYERNQGKSSMWAPFIETLPQEPSCGWYWGPEHLDRLDKPAPTSWPDRLEQVRSYALDELEEMADYYCEPLDISLPSLMWALGQVHSRAVDERQALAPCIDLINHMDGTAAPAKLPIPGTLRRNLAVYSVRDGEQQALAPGQELYIDYLVQDPFDCYVHYGWLPQELKPVQLGQT